MVFIAHQLEYKSDQNVLNDLNNRHNHLYNTFDNQITLLKNSDFSTGTYRITEPGKYQLSEDIIFNPNPNNDFMPTDEQTQGADAEYPIRAYHLGFFAAITIECKDVILDLNGKTIKQSEDHNLIQRFYANIELNTAPFIAGQGPSKNGFSNNENFKSAVNCYIHNGILGLSSHHGIHGNNNKYVAIKDLKIVEYEVAGIALNGSEHSALCDITCDGTNEIKVLSTFSQAIFMNRFLKQKLNMVNAPTLTLQGEVLTLENIQQKLESDINETIKECKENKEITNYFKNTTKLYDGNMYGILLNVNGVAVGGFNSERTEEMVGNINNVLININVQNIITSPIEVIGISNKTGDEVYGKKVQVGPFGDVLDITKLLNDENMYKGTSLSNAQLLLSKLETGKGTTSIDQCIVEWAENETNINEVMEENQLYYVGGGDSMAHTMKGNIGYYINCGKDISIYNSKVNNIQTDKKHQVGTTNFIDQQNKVYTGAYSYSFIVNSSENILINNMKYTDNLNYPSHPNLSNINLLQDRN